MASTLEGEAQNILVSPYGFPTDRFTPKVSRGPGPFTVLALGALSVRKGTPYLLEAWRRAGLRDARLVLVGRMDLSEKFLRGYAGIFEHLPSTPRARLGEHYRAADLVVFPAIADGFGLVVLESMCSGTPVLATRASGGPDCITDGEDGLLAPARDVDALVDLLRVAARDLDRLEQMGKRARMRAEARSWAVAGRERSAQLEALRA